jgi:hypothetical protein
MQNVGKKKKRKVLAIVAEDKVIIHLTAMLHATLEGII